MITILGAGGSVGNELARRLAAGNRPFRLVKRHPITPPAGAEFIAADLADANQTLNAVAGSEIVFLLVGLKYDFRTWRDVWPRVLGNTIEACKRAGAKLVFFDNVYMYGRVAEAMTEETPFNPCSKKGEIRAKLATTLMNTWQAGSLEAMIARSADFYGPGDCKGLPNLLVFEALAKRKKPSWLVNASAPHSFTYTPDAAAGLIRLIDAGRAWNQTWHLPTAPNPPTGRELIALAADAWKASPDCRVLGRLLIWLAGRMDPVVRESYEMLYQYEQPYIFSSAKFAAEFGASGTPYAEGIRTIAASYLQKTPAA